MLLKRATAEYLAHTCSEDLLPVAIISIEKRSLKIQNPKNSADNVSHAMFLEQLLNDQGMFLAVKSCLKALFAYVLWHGKAMLFAIGLSGVVWCKDAVV